MKNKVIITYGLPASGKSTWAKEQVKNSNGQIKRVNKDDLREMIDTGNWSKEREKEIESMQEMIVRNYLAHGYTVIVDNTHLAPKWIPYMQEIADSFGIPMEVKRFDTPVGECVRRDAERENPVGSRVINDMYNKWTRKAPVYTAGDTIICDIDGTLAHMEGRSPYDGSKVSEDILDYPIATLLDKFKDYNIVMLSGRNEKYRKETTKWLDDNYIKYDELYMRAEDDVRCDAIIKKELLLENIEIEDVLFVLDDRNRVVDMWRSLGLKCLQCEPGDF